jgi:Tfp pilus assembly protein PilW
MRSEAGLTLIEIAIGMALLSTAAVVATMSYTSVAKLQQKEVQVRSVQQTGRYILEAMVRDIRNSSGFDINGTTLTVTNSVSNKLQVRYVWTDSDGNGQNDRLERSTCIESVCGQAQPVASDIQVTRLSYDAPGLPPAARPFIKINMTVERVDPDPTSKIYNQAYDLSTTVSMRGL